MRARLKRNLLLLVAVVGVALLPLPGAIWRWGWPLPGFKTFPVSQAGAAKPGFNPYVFAGGAVVAALIVLVVITPRLFGFQRSRSPRRRVLRVALPWWFWAGAVVNLTSWFTMWFGQLPTTAYAFVPLWWGFIVATDGVVYARAGGRSLLASAPRRMLALAAVSIPAWSFFEFMNYYAVEFWVYPINTIFPPRVQAIWFLLSFSTVWPAIFEWYTLLHTFDALWNRWADGRRLEPSRFTLWTALGFGAIAMMLFGAFPFSLFVLLWAGPPLVLTSALALLGMWTPFRPIRHGNWSPVVMVGLAGLANGVCWELWNYGSRAFRTSQLLTAVINPNYWYYDIPYVNVLHPFSEMPLLGYFGYVPFGALAWVFWLVIAHVLELDPIFDLTRLSPEPNSDADAHWLTAS